MSAVEWATVPTLVFDHCGGMNRGGVPIIQMRSRYTGYMRNYFAIETCSSVCTWTSMFNILKFLKYKCKMFLKCKSVSTNCFLWHQCLYSTWLYQKYVNTYIQTIKSMIKYIFHDRYIWNIYQQPILSLTETPATVQEVSKYLAAQYLLFNLLPKQIMNNIFASKTCQSLAK